MTFIELILRPSNFSHLGTYIYGVICMTCGVLLGIWTGFKIKKIKETSENAPKENQEEKE